MHIKSTSRTTIPLQNTYSRNNAALDYRSHLVLSWVDAWVRDNGGLKAPFSATIRRALMVYVAHLEGLPAIAIPAALSALKDAAHGRFASAADRDAANIRLMAVGSSKPFDVVYRGQYAVDETAALNARLAVLNV